MAKRIRLITDRFLVILFAFLVGAWTLVCGVSALWALVVFGGTVVAVGLRTLQRHIRLASAMGVVVLVGLNQDGLTRGAGAVAVVVVAVLLGAAWTARSRRIVGANFLVLVGLLGLAEVGLRATTAWDGARNFQPIEMYRSTVEGGPDEATSVNASNEGGLRRTTDQPSAAERRVLIFGGSTTACNEVSDTDTWPSALQRLLGGTKSKWRVENHGVSAATAANRVTALKASVDLQPGDLVIFYVGVNDAGVSFTLREVPVPLLAEIPRLNTALRRLSKHSLIADRLFRILVFGGISTSEQARADALLSFRDALSEASSLAEANGARFVPVLQAHLFTRANPTDFDRGLAALYSMRLRDAVESMYPALWDVVRGYENAIDARSAQDQLERSPYYDWHHVDARGNQAIAKFIFERINW